MTETLIIVESPAKARTLRRFLGSNFNVQASMGHVRDLPERSLAVDVNNLFAPNYVVVESRKKIIGELIRAAKDADEVILASDPDREGEAIAWHLAEVLKLRSPKRIEFHEITESAVKNALKSPRPIDMNRVNAQQARRIVDRLVGYKISPYLWRNLERGLSAGRVQSVALRLVCDREQEIRIFVTEESWSLNVLLSKLTDENQFKAHLHHLEGSDEKIEFKKKEDLDPVLKDLEKAVYRVIGCEQKNKQKYPYLPYITSSLQQDASTRLRFAPKRTMKIAQELYEGVDVGEGGPVGLITYMRTDSTRVADEAEVKLFAYIRDNYGADYVGGKRKEKERAHAQGAHEAIRPTDISRTPDQIKAHLSPDQAKVYELIWRRFVASRMSAARFQISEAEILASKYVFRATGSVLLFDGFYKVWERDERDIEPPIPSLTIGDALRFYELLPEQHFTQPPARYTEASLIKELEKRGIGRPSTYASIISTIQERGYVIQEERRLNPTPIGEEVIKVLSTSFTPILNDEYTSDIETRLDAVEEGKTEWVDVVSDFYEPLMKMLSVAEKAGPIKTDEICPECKEGHLVFKSSRYGRFLACERYPDCKYRKSQTPEAEQVGICPKCSRPLLKRRSRFGEFVSCSGYPECDYRLAGKPTDKICPKCSKALVERKSRFGKFLSCSGYPECDYKEGRQKKKPVEESVVEGQEILAEDKGTGKAPDKLVEGEICPQCSSPMVKRKGKFGSFLSCSNYPTCKGTKQVGGSKARKPRPFSKKKKKKVAVD